MPRLVPKNDLLKLRGFFLEALYTPQGLQGLLSSPTPGFVRNRNRSRLLYLSREATPLGRLFRLFLLGEAVAAGEAAEMFPAWVLDLCFAAGLLRKEGGRLIADVVLQPIDDFLIASDPFPRGVAPRDLVMGVNASSGRLARAIPANRFEATLDLGTGMGIQALSLAAQSGTVVATDLNPRAVEFAAFNAALNGAANIEFLTGDRFAPVEGRTFDLIVSNPPYVLSPTTRHLFSDNDMELDSFCRTLVGDAPRYLAEGGYLLMICEWVGTRGEPWQQRLGGWFAGCPCDVWVLKDYTYEPSLYVEGMFEDSILKDSETTAAAYRRWMDAYRGAGVEAIHGGYIAMRKRQGTNWFRCEELAQRLEQPFGDAIIEGFARQDFLEAHASDEALLAARPKLSPDAILRQDHQASGGLWEAGATKTLLLGGGLGHATTVDQPVAELAAMADGTHTIAELIERLRSKPGQGEADLHGEYLRVVRQLFAQGFLVP